jgi:preprotein translocase subunit SecG
MIYFLTTVHVIICLFLIVVVLLQSGKAADLAGAFGGMGSQTAFGPRGAATMLSKATAIAAVLFMIVSIWLGIEQGYVRGGAGSGSVIESTGVAGEITPPPAATQPLPAGTSVDVTPVTPEEAPAEAPPAQ